MLSLLTSPRSVARASLLLLLLLATGLLPALVPRVLAQSAPPATSPGALPDDPATGVLTGVVVSPEGSLYEGVQITLKPAFGALNPVPLMSTITDSSGTYRFSGVPSGPFEITIAAGGFAPQTLTGTLSPGAAFTAPVVTLIFASTVSQVEVTASTREIAAEQLHYEEKQRVLGLIPNFYVVYDPGVVPLSARQKFHLFWRTQIDPVTIAAAAFTAGYQQAGNEFSGYGQGTRGYFKRFGADYADSVVGNAIGGAILPSILRQDPRYYYLGHGTIRHRALYAIANSIICKGDNGHWQLNYSSIGGSFAAGAISNLYYPASDRNGVGLTFQNAALGIAGGAGGNLFQEFLVRKLTPHLPNYNKPQP